MSVPRKSTRRLNASIASVCLVGLALSYYAYIVETAKERDDTYTAMCDISNTISCTKVFSTEYGKGFGIIPKTSIFYLPNPLYGLMFYTLVAVLGLCNNYSISIVNIVLGIISNVGSIYLTSILYSIKTICVVCLGTYVVNAIILILVIKKHRKQFYRRKSKKN